MATLSQARKAEIAEELKVIATWVAGPRKAKVLALAAEITGEDEPPATVETKVEEKAKADKADKA